MDLKAKARSCVGVQATAKREVGQEGITGRRVVGERSATQWETQWDGVYRRWFNCEKWEATAGF